MLTLLFVVIMISILGKILVWSIKAAWSIGKALFSIVFLPLIMIVMVSMGMVYIAVAILVICGIAMIIRIWHRAI